MGYHNIGLYQYTSHFNIRLEYYQERTESYKKHSQYSYFKIRHIIQYVFQLYLVTNDSFQYILIRSLSKLTAQKRQYQNF